MKKLIYLLSVTFLLLQSCSSGEDSSSGSSVILCKKMGPGNFTIDYVYNGNKIEKTMINDQILRKYYYTGNLISKVEDYIDNQVRVISTFTYNNNQLISHLIIFYPYPADPFEPIYAQKTDFTHNSNNTISYEIYSGTPTEQSTLVNNGTITLINGEIGTVENNSGTITNYTYDNKNSPFKNVLGVDKIIPYPFTQCDFDSKKHNLISKNSSDGSSWSLNYQYNNQDYPSSSVYDNTSVSPRQYFY